MKAVNRPASERCLRWKVECHLSHYLGSRALHSQLSVWPPGQEVQPSQSIK